MVIFIAILYLCVSTICEAMQFLNGNEMRRYIGIDEYRKLCVNNGNVRKNWIIGLPFNMFGSMKLVVPSLVS